MACTPRHWSSWAGTLGAIGGYVFQALALAHGSLLLVQPLLVSSLLLVLPLGARFSNQHVRARDWVWALPPTTTADGPTTSRSRPSPPGCRPPPWMARCRTTMPTAAQNAASSADPIARACDANHSTVGPLPGLPAISNPNTRSDSPAAPTTRRRDRTRRCSTTPGRGAAGRGSPARRRAPRAAAS